LISTKPNRCQHCKARFSEAERGHKLHSDCIEPWLATQKAKQASKEAKEQKARQRVERAMTKKRKEAIKTIPNLIAEAQIAFNAFIRERDRDQPCICCGLPLGAGEVGGAYDCGHYRSRGAAGHLRFDERNAHGQRKYCNKHRAGNAVEYRIGLIKRIGLEAVEALESDNSPIKWDRDVLRQIKTIYRAKTRALRKEQS
jgi:hypothetical protein